MKLSFDFDNTLSRHNVQEFATQLIHEGHEVWIVTSRYSEDGAPEFLKNSVRLSNVDVFMVAEDCGIDLKHIHFTNMEPKVDFLATDNFLFHVDDDVSELFCIREHTTECIPVNVDFLSWQEDCIKLITIQ